MDDSSYERLAVETFKVVLDLFQDVDPEDADIDHAGDVIRIVLNTQRPVHQLWLAGGQSAWHFSYDDAAACWRDDKGRGELFAILRGLTKDALGLDLV